MTIFDSFKYTFTFRDVENGGDIFLRYPDHIREEFHRVWNLKDFYKTKYIYSDEEVYQHMKQYILEYGVTK